MITDFNICLIGVAGQCGNTDNTFLLDKLCGEIFGFVDENTIAAQVVCGKKCFKNLICRIEEITMISFSDCTAPFAVQFVTNAIAADTTGAQTQRGVCLEYKQVTC